MIIREVSLDECEDILKIEQACFSDSWSVEDFEHQVNSPYSKLIGVFVENKLVGFINTVCVVDELEINNVAVLKEYRRNHLGEEMIRYVLSVYSDVDRVLLEVRESNIPALKLYEKLGFVKYGKRKNYYKEPIENAVLMIIETGN